MVIWVDADACPKGANELIARASARLQLPVRLVANRPLTAPSSALIEVVQVSAGSNVADNYIVQHVAAGDLVVTAHIPLASLVVARGATALDPRGEVHTPDSIGESLAVRNLMEELRWAGSEVPLRPALSTERQMTAEERPVHAPYLPRPYEHHWRSSDEQLRASRDFLATMARRRTVRDFAPTPVPFELIENAVRAAALAPSGANQQPWSFVVVSDPELKRRLREAAEAEKRESYERPYLLIPVGYPAAGATVPAITKKPLEEVLVHLAARENPPSPDGPTTE